MLLLREFPRSFFGVILAPLFFISIPLLAKEETPIPFHLQQKSAEDHLSPHQLSQQVSEKLFESTNQIRAKKKLPPLQSDKILQKAALDHSQDMLKRNYLGHFSPEGKSAVDRVGKYRPNPRQSLGENVHTIKSSKGLTDAEAIASLMIKDWLGSPEHRRNILAKDYVSIGVECASDLERIFCTQVFGGPIYPPRNAKPKPKSDLDL